MEEVNIKDDHSIQEIPGHKYSKSNEGIIDFNKVRVDMPSIDDDAINSNRHNSM